MVRLPHLLHANRGFQTLVLSLCCLTLTACISGPHLSGAADQASVNQQFQNKLNQARLGNAQAQYEIGVAYEGGLGTELDLYKALYWYQKAALQNHLQAHYQLGTTLTRGHFIRPDYDRGIVHLEAAARQGHELAMTSLAKLFSTADTPNKNPVKAYAWFTLLIHRQGPDIEQLTGHRQQLSEQMTSSQIMTALTLARQYQLELDPRNLVIDK